MFRVLDLIRRGHGGRVDLSDTFIRAHPGIARPRRALGPLCRYGAPFRNQVSALGPRQPRREFTEGQTSKALKPVLLGGGIELVRFRATATSRGGWGQPARRTVVPLTGHHTCMFNKTRPDNRSKWDTIPISGTSSTGAAISYQGFVERRWDPGKTAGRTRATVRHTTRPAVDLRVVVQGVEQRRMISPRSSSSTSVRATGAARHWPIVPCRNGSKTPRRRLPGVFARAVQYWGKNFSAGRRWMRCARDPADWGGGGDDSAWFAQTAFALRTASDLTVNGVTPTARLRRGCFFASGLCHPRVRVRVPPRERRLVYAVHIRTKWISNVHPARNSSVVVCRGPVASGVATVWLWRRLPRGGSFFGAPTPTAPMPGS